MPKQNVSVGAARTQQVLHPDSPLHGYAPGNLARLSPDERAQALKRKKGVQPDAAFTSARTVLGE